MKAEIKIVDQGRGPQLSTSRITVQDVLPYLQDGSSYEEIMRWIPVLTAEEIAVIERYIDQHRLEVMEADRRIRERNAGQRNPPQVEQILQEGRAERLALMEKLRRCKDNGEGS